jgi:hypothetical protein
MRRISLHLFFVLALAVAVGLAVAVSPYASSSPDGLEKVADEQGFLARGELHAIQDDSPIPDYAFPGIESAFWSTALAGFVGTILVAGIAYGIGRLTTRRHAHA